jgi:hypothetical protein
MLSHGFVQQQKKREKKEKEKEKLLGQSNKIYLNMRRQVKMNHGFHISDVKAARSHICGKQHCIGVPFKSANIHRKAGKAKINFEHKKVHQRLRKIQF